MVVCNKGKKLLKPEGRFPQWSWDYRQSVPVEGSLSVGREAGEPHSEDTPHPCAHRCVIPDYCGRYLQGFVCLAVSQLNIIFLIEGTFFFCSLFHFYSLPIAKVITVIERNIYSRTLTSGRWLWNRYLCSIALWPGTPCRSPDLAVFYALGWDQLLSQQCTPAHSSRHICLLPSADFLWVPAGI